MTKKKKNLSRRYRILFFYYLRRIWRAKIQFLRVSFFVFILFLLVLQSPWVQTFLLQKGADYLSQKTGFPIVLEEANIDFLGRIHIENLRVGDLSGKKMIAVKNLLIDFDLLELYQNRQQITLNKISAGQLDFLLMINPETKQYNINEFVASLQKLIPKPNPKKPKKYPPAFIVQEISLNNSSFTMHDPLKDSVDFGQFDPFHFKIDSIFAKAEGLRVYRDTVEVDVKKIKGIEKSIDFPIKNITTYFRYCNHALSFLGLNATFGNSVLRDTVIFEYDNPADMNDFMNKVQVKAHLDSTVLQIKDLAVFAPQVKNISEILSASGNIKGTLDQLHSPNIQVNFGKNTFLKGKFRLNGLSDVQNTFVELEFGHSHINVEDFETYLNPKDFEYIAGLGQIEFRGDFLGFFGDFVTRGTFETNFGKIETDLNLKLRSKTYKGKIALTDFDLGAWLGTKLIGKIQMNGEIQGAGFKQKEADFQLDAQISSLDVNNYHYQNIRTDGRFEEQHFTGKLKINDPNLSIRSDGDLNLKDSTFTFKAHIDTVNLLGLGYSKKKAFFKTYINADFRGLDIDKIDGAMHLSDTYFSHNGNAIDLDYMSIFFNNGEGNEREINVYSALADIETRGNFKIKQLLKDLENDWQAYQVYAQNDSVNFENLVDNLAQNVIDTSHIYEVFADISLKNINPLVQIFIPKLYISEDTYIKGRFFHETEKYYTLESNIDTLIYGKNHLYNSLLTLSAEKHADSSAIDLELHFISREQKASKIELENFELTAKLKSKKIHFETFVKRIESDDEFYVKGIFDFADTIQHLQIEPQKIIFFEHNWKLQDKFLNLSINKKEISFDNPVVFASHNQEVWLNGGISPDSKKVLKIGVNDLNINVLSHFIKREVEGILNVNASISGVYDTLVANSDIVIENIKLDGYEVGDFRAFSYWDDVKNDLAIHGGLSQKDREVLDLVGAYRAENKENPINMDLKMIGLDLKTFEPFLIENISEIQGKIYGAVKIKGKPTNLDFVGEAFVDRGIFKINYLNTKYHFSDKITFQKEYFGVDNFKLYDQDNKLALLTGGIYLNSFQDMFVDIEGKIDHFMALNTTQKDNSLYYGTAFGTGEFGVRGSFRDLNIWVDAKSEANTNIYLPLDGYQGISEQHFIRFVQKDTAQNVIEKRFKTPEFKLGITMNLEITPDAYMEIIFDKKAGDIMRGNARGKIKMNIDTDGDFEMFGDVEIVKGAYNFTFLNVVNKEFGVKKGSRISWSGDPYHADLDLVATYSQLASFAPILQVDSLAAQSPELKRRYPVQVNLLLKGDLMSPDIGFGIEFSEYPPVVMAAGQAISLEGQLARFRRQIANNPQELNRQAFSLIVLKKFSAENAFQGINQSAGNSVSELLSNQLSYWASQVDDNFEVNLDLGGLSQEDFNALQLRLSYSFLNGRVRVTREGGFTNVQNEANVASIAGNWTVEYTISKDGKLRAKAFHKSNANTFSSSLGNASSTGASMLYTISFDHFKDILKKARKKGQKLQ